MNLQDSITFWIGKGIASLIPLAIVASVVGVVFAAAVTIDAATNVARKARTLASSGVSRHRAWWQVAGPVPFIVVALVVTFVAVAVAMGVTERGVR